MSSQTDSVQPPRIAVWLVSLFTPVGDVESIQGDLLEEFTLLRRSTMILIKNLTDEDWGRLGTANNVSVSVRALIYVMAGHIEHHLTILKERYLT